MTHLAAYHAAARPGRALFPEPLFAAAAALIALSLTVTLAAAALEPRLFEGANVWLKPIKFQVSLALYLGTLAFFARWLPGGMLHRRDYRAFAGLVVFAVAAELVWIGGAAMYGTASHFNDANPAMAGLYELMGVLAVILTSASLVYGIAIARNRASGLDPAIRLAVVLGLVLTFVLTVPVAGTMANAPGHFVGTPVTGAAVPVFGWSREVGDLRVPHFLATHAMHFLPLAGWLVASLLPPRAALGAVWAMAAGFTALVGASFLAALAGLPAIPAG